MIKSLTKEWKHGRDIGLLIFRAIFGFSMFYGHGLPKLQTLMKGGEIQFADPIGLGVTFSFYLVIFAEVVGSIMLILGIYTRLALIPLIIAMLVAVFAFHSGQAFGKYEMSFLYLSAFIALFFTGAGKYAIDARLK